MWAHYADNHKGFCIEYELSYDEPNNPFFDVTYSSQLPKLSLTELLFNPQEAITRILTTKYIDWHYEKELRIIYLNQFKQSGRNGELIDYPTSLSPTKIITGAKFNSQNEPKIKKIADTLKIEHKKYSKLFRK